MKIYSADTWTVEELTDQVADAGRRSLVVPAADSRKEVLATFGEALEFPEHYGVNLDALNDSLHDFADAISDNGEEPLTVIWQVPAAFRSDRSFGIICEILQDAESYAGKDLAVIAVLL
ncbi:barstar family protein [Arthrobacter pascens]|uniref:barstar family protein n=1 Tax=Arthrobacter pascens TaxID=1677 RepID=UPI00196A7BC0|nr:barstar family protein [Arthrobacter pascens]MBN3497034.1 barstar family protein [Arthrobacter pascens]MDR6557725.1 RNAse (barnase) inhibitor barstar [Arthrobacter pascens]